MRSEFSSNTGGSDIYLQEGGLDGSISHISASQINWKLLLFLTFSALVTIAKPKGISSVKMNIKRVL